MPALSAAERRLIYERANGCCEYCQSQADFATQPFSVEHIFPRSKGGLDVLDNLALSCQGCNAHKYNKTEGPDPLNRESAPFFHPRTQKWGEHFAWNGDYTHIIGLTASARATIFALKMNRKELVNLRRVLFMAGEHPPKVNQSEE